MVSESLRTYITQMYSQIGPNGPQTRIQHHAHLRGSILRIRVRAFFLDKSASRSFFRFFFCLQGVLAPPPGVGGRGKARWGTCGGRRRIKPKKGKSRLSIRFHQVQILAVKYFMKRASDRPTMPLIMPHMCPYRPGAIYSTPGEPQRPLCVKTRLSFRFHRR